MLYYTNRYLEIDTKVSLHLLQLLSLLCEEKFKNISFLFFKDSLQINTIADILELFLLRKENAKINYLLKQSEILRFFFKKVAVKVFSQ